MRTFADAPPAAHHGDPGGAREPGADLPFPDCSCPAPPLDVTAVRFLTEVDVVAVLAAARAACLHRCPGWPDRRR